jgi:short chain dehydrogenase
LGHFSPSPLRQLSSQSGPKIKVLRWVRVKAPSAVVVAVRKTRYSVPKSRTAGHVEWPHRIQQGQANGNRQEMFSLTGKTAIVTGAGRGLGEHISKGLAQMGAFVFCAGRNVEPLQQVCTSIHGIGGKAKPLVFDVSREDDATAAIDRVATEKGSISSFIMSVHAIVVRSMPYRLERGCRLSRVG